jgi:hypothetical protein
MMTMLPKKRKKLTQGARSKTQKQFYFITLRSCGALQQRKAHRIIPVVSVITQLLQPPEQ